MHASAAISAKTVGYPGRIVKRILPILAALVALGVAPAANAGVPDFYSGQWPAKLMPSNEALGTITWRPIDATWARFQLGQPFGGAPFTDCPSSPDTRFFRGLYGTGGELIACTTTADGKTLHGRYDGGGGEFRPGSFTISIVENESDFREFFGVYVEDGGITTDWCGELVMSSLPDTVAPSALALPSVGRAGHKVGLRVSASDDRGAAKIAVTVKRAGRTIASFASGFRKVSGSTVAVSWKAPRRLRGHFTFCVRAADRGGNLSARSCSTLILR